MSDLSSLSAIAGLSGLNERDSYYQYLINNNSTSTMVNALSGDLDESNGSNLSGITNLLGQASSLTGNASSSLSGLSSLLGSSTSDGDISSLSTISSFSQILKTYLTAEQTEAAKMANTMSEALKEADANGEDKSLTTYKTVQELYDYFTSKASAEGKSNIASAADSTGTKSSSVSDTDSSTSEQSLASAGQASAAEFDFDGFESDVDSSIESVMASTGIIM